MLKLITTDGWVLVRSRGSHRQFHHPTKVGTVTIPGKPKDDLHPKTAASILKQAGLITASEATDTRPEQEEGRP
jgi:predicted RNA binding protein YcfA (HicA-like mRNA interferase family)